MSVNPGYFSSFFVIFAVIFYFSIVSMNKARTAISIFFIFSFLYPSSSLCILLLSGPIYYPSFPSSSVLNGTIAIVSVFFAFLLCLLFSSAMCVSVLKIKCQENNV